MADWSQMPEELLRLIARRLGTQFDVLRFRSVCSSWRSSVAPSLKPFPNGRFPIIPDDGTGVDFLCKRTIYLLGAPRSGDRTVPSGWLLKVAEDVPWGMNTLNPLSICESAPLPEDFPRVLDLMNLRVVELGHEDVFHGKLAMFKSREKRWSIVQDMPSPYDDMISFKGEFYTVDNAGRTVVVGLDLSVTLIAQPNFDGLQTKCLVESVGELLLVYMHWDETPRFKVYKLDREEKVWNEVKDLGDRVLFLGDECTFSASAADLGACKGNCIFFIDQDGDIAASSLKIVVYDMESGIFGPIEDYAGYSELFWPPPDWIASKTSEVSICFLEFFQSSILHHR
ncbi:F-box protein SKIP23 isoform X2 [Eucalyptus grandis]|uniref:F-box protein SKIP23 isoform X2 n=1 Tax=Eucalyptus grandis TaxID=71139 RepID=UPI00192E96F0|nr:F-box protein SKIP23 isoform X2 [Eucalyptus grandis]